MQIAFVTTHYWPSLGGAERVAANLAEVYRAEGHEVRAVVKRLDDRLLGPMAYVFQEGPRVAPSSVAGVQVRQLRLSRRRRALLLPLAGESVPLVGRLPLRRVRRRNVALYANVVRPALTPLLAGADVVHALGGGLLAAAAVEAAHHLGRPAAITPLAHPGPRGFDAGTIRACRGADAVLATVPADAAGYRGMDVADERLHVCGLPVPGQGPGRSRSSGRSDESALAPAVPDDAPVVLFLGARREAKGWRLLHQSAPLVWERAPQARFAFVGPGEDLPGGDDRVLDVGRVSDDERDAWIRRATVLCLPSDWESFGLVVAEAWSEGVPVVVSDTPVLRELVDGSGGGVVAAREPRAIADAVVRLLELPEAAREMGRAGRRFWEQECDPVVVGRRHLAIYEELVSCLRASWPF